jgi:hypothetical protein
VTEYVLEPAAAEFARAAAHSPPVYELTPAEADGVEARVCIVKPVGATDLSPCPKEIRG